MKTIVYTVRKGDTLYDIAKRCGTTVNMMAGFNGISDPDMIYEGQILRIPVSELPCVKGKDNKGYIEYTVKKGDTLAEIAVLYDTGVERLADINGISDPDMIYEGQLILIPQKRKECSYREYTVKKGDTLSNIAEYLGTTTEMLAAQNSISDPDIISEGQGLTVSDSGTDNEGRLEYKVVSGDTLWGIAKKYGVSVAYLINLNRLTMPDCLDAGQILVIRK